MKKQIGKRIFSILTASIMLISIFSVCSVFFSVSATNNGWEVGGSGGKVNLSSNGSATTMTFASGYNWQNEWAHLPHKLAPVATNTFAFKFKAENLTGGWIPFVLGWEAASATPISGSLFSTGLFFNVTNGNLEIRNCSDAAPSNNSAAIANVAINTAESHVLTIKLENEATNLISVSVDGVKAIEYQNATMATQLKFVFPTGSLLGLTLTAGGADNTAITFDTNATLWEIVGNKEQASITGDTNIANINFTGGNHQTVYTQISHNFKPFSKGAWAYQLNVKSLSSWAVLMACWEVTLGSPVLSNSGIFFSLEAGGSTGQQLSVKKQGTAGALLGPLPISLNKNYKIVFECDNLGNISVFVDGTLLGTYNDNAMTSALIADYPFAGFDGITFATGGDGAYSLTIDTSATSRTKTELNSMITESSSLNNGVAGNTSTPEYGQVTAAQKSAFTSAISTAQTVYNNASSTAAEITAAYDNLKAAKELFASQIVPLPEKTALQSVYDTAKQLYDSTSVGLNFGQVPQSDKNAFDTAITATKSVLDSRTADQATVNAAKTALDTAVATFNGAILKNGDPAQLKARILVAKSLLNKLKAESSDHTSLSELISQSEAVAANPESMQTAIDEKYQLLGDKIADINAHSKFWEIASLDSAHPASGISIKTDGYKSTIASQAGASSWNAALITTTVAKTNKLVFNISENLHPDNDWSTIRINNGITGDILHTKSIAIVFGGSGGNGEINTDITLSDPANKNIASFGYSLKTEVQFNFELVTEGETEKIVVKVGGSEIGTITAPQFVEIFKHDLTIAYTSGNTNGEFNTDIDLRPRVEYGYGTGDFAPVAMAGSGLSTALSVYKNGEVQTVSFNEGCTFTEGIATTKLTGPVLEFSLKIKEQGITDWHALLLSGTIETHAANTRGLTLAFGGDLSVQVKEFGQSGMGGSPLWLSEDGGFTKLNKKMRFKIYEDKTDGKLVVVMNDKVIARKDASDIVALLNSGKYNLSLFGSGDASSEFEISYINKEDPKPFDSLEDTLDDLEPADIISLDDAVVTVSSDKKITYTGTLTITDLFSYLYVPTGYRLVAFDATDTEISDLTQDAKLVKRIGVYFNDMELNTYAMNGFEGNPDTGENSAVIFYGIMILLSFVSFSLFVKKYCK